MVKRILFLFFVMLMMQTSQAQLNEVPYNSDSTFYRVDLALNNPGKCYYLYLEYDSLKTLPWNFSQLGLLRGITFRYCVDVDWDNVFTELAKLPNLEYLEISICKLTKLPESISKLYQVKTINLKTNDLVVLPSGITSCSNLTSLQLQFNPKLKMSDLEKKLVKMDHLESLNLSGCRINNFPE